MTTETLTLSQFLEARIAETEGAALAAAPGPWIVEHARVWSGEPNPNKVELLIFRGSRDWSSDANHIARNDPARVLATCKAHRAIVEAHPVSTEYEAEYCMTCQWDVDCDAPKHDHQDGAGEYPCPTLRALASIYADQPAFDPRWAL